MNEERRKKKKQTKSRIEGEEERRFEKRWAGKNEYWPDIADRGKKRQCYSLQEARLLSNGPLVRSFIIVIGGVSVVVVVVVVVVVDNHCFFFFFFAHVLQNLAGGQAGKTKKRGCRLAALASRTDSRAFFLSTDVLMSHAIEVDSC
jgi:hypothetical protein